MMAAKPLATGTRISKGSKSNQRWFPEGVFRGTTRIPKKAY